MYKILMSVESLSFFFNENLNVEELLDKAMSLKNFLFSGLCKTIVKDWEEFLKNQSFALLLEDLLSKTVNPY